MGGPGSGRLEDPAKRLIGFNQPTPTGPDSMYLPNVSAVQPAVLKTSPAVNVSAETDPIYSAWIAGPPNVSEFTNDVPYLSSYTETDPVFMSLSGAFTQQTYSTDLSGAHAITSGAATTHINDATIHYVDPGFTLQNYSTALSGAHAITSGAATAHINDNTQAHSDYLLNTGDTATGNYTIDTPTFHIDSTNHRVGIGTTSPSQKLYVDGGQISVSHTTGIINTISSTGTNAVYHTFTNTGGTAYVGLENSAGNGLSSGGTAYAFDITGPAADIPIQFATGASNLVRMTILGNGNVGIGTTGPGYKLTVAGGDIAIDTEKKIYLDGGGDTYITEVTANRIELFASSVGLYAVDNEWNVGFNSNSNVEMKINNAGYQSGATQFRDLGIYDGKGTNILFVDGSAGNVGIGLTAPSTKLHISGGSFTISNTTAPATPSGAGRIFVSGGACWFIGSSGTQTRLAVA